MDPYAGPDRDHVHTHIHDQLKTLFNIEDSSGMELFIMLQRVAHLSRLLDAQSGDDLELSGPRWRLLLRLLIEEEQGNSAGLTPTVLSQSQRVGKNTISALLRGLEAQGLIQRTLDSADLRTFRIQLTQAGRDYLRGSGAGAHGDASTACSPGSTSRSRRSSPRCSRSCSDPYGEQCHHPAGMAGESQTAGVDGAPLTEEYINQ